MSNIFLNKLNFKKSELKLSAGTKLLEATYKRKTEFSRKEILRNANDLAKQFNDKDVKIGVSIHYNNNDMWGSAILTSSKFNIPIWNPDDSPDTKEAYKDDYINAVHFFVLKSNVDDPKVKHRTPKKAVLK